MSDIARLSVIIFFVSVIFSIVFAKLGIFLSQRFRIIDYPKTAAHKQHKKATPLAGGLILFLTMVLIFIFFNGVYSQEVKAILASATIVFIFGIADDVKRLSPLVKFTGQIFAVFLLVRLGIHVSIVKAWSPSINLVLNILITAIWVIGVTNAFNLIDSADGLAASISAIAISLLLVGSVIALQPQLLFQSVALLAALLILIFYNLPPAQLFLGDSGAQLLGFLTASLAILYNPVIQPPLSSWFVPITFVAVPIFDVCLVFFSRIRRGLPFFKPDRNHSYHRLIEMGFSHSRAIWLMDVAAFLIGTAGIFALYQDPFMANFLFALIVIAGIVIYFILELRLGAS